MVAFETGLESEVAATQGSRMHRRVTADLYGRCFIPALLELTAAIRALLPRALGSSAELFVLAAAVFTGLLV